MVCYGVFGKKVAGNGGMDKLIKKSTAHKYHGENHAYSVDPNHIGKNYAWVGPRTAVSTGEKLYDYIHKTY